MGLASRPGLTTAMASSIDAPGCIVIRIVIWGLQGTCDSMSGGLHAVQGMWHGIHGKSGGGPLLSWSFCSEVLTSNRAL